MTQLPVTINNKVYNLSCEPNEVTHLQKCAEYTNEKIRRVAQGCKATSEVALMAMTMLALVDEIQDLKAQLHELKKNTQSVQQEIQYVVPTDMIERLEKLHKTVDVCQ